MWHRRPPSITTPSCITPTTTITTTAADYSIIYYTDPRITTIVAEVCCTISCIIPVAARGTTITTMAMDRMGIMAITATTATTDIIRFFSGLFLLFFIPDIFHFFAQTIEKGWPSGCYTVQCSLWYLPLLVTRYLSFRLNLWADTVTRLNLLRKVYTVHSTRSAEHDRFKQSISFHIMSAVKIELQLTSMGRCQREHCIVSLGCLSSLKKTKRSFNKVAASN